MILFHGTTIHRARRICQEGFLPRRPSRRVWFAKGKGYAQRRARTQARRSHDRPVVLTCDIDLHRFRERLGKKRMFFKNGILSIAGPVPVSALRSYPIAIGQPCSPEELVAWVNRLLGLKSYKGPGRRHPGILRLSRWVINRLTSIPGTRISQAQLLDMARRWLSEYFEGVEIDPSNLQVHRRPPTVEVEVGHPEPALDPREDRALEYLESPHPRQRTRGLKLLEQIEDPDLFQWCAMFLAAESTEVRITALHTLLRTEAADSDIVLPLVDSKVKRIRAAAIAVLVKHSGNDSTRWFERGLKDPSSCVRTETARLLHELDPTEHRKIFELALYDPNPQVSAVAKKLTTGKGFAKVRIPTGEFDWSILQTSKKESK